jgi:hypothetical protein
MLLAADKRDVESRYGPRMTALHDLTALEQAAAVRRRETSARELVDHYADRIAAHDATVGAFVTTTLDTAREQADEADAAVARGDDLPPLHGVPIGIKDLNLTAGVRTTLGSRAFESNVPQVSDFVGAPAARRRDDQPGQDPRAGVRPALLHRDGPGAAGPHAVGPVPLSRRLQRRGRRCGRRRAAALRPGQRRRRLDPHPGQRLRAVRHQAGPRPHQRRAR